jgi:hypothetical protein
MYIHYNSLICDLDVLISFSFLLLFIKIIFIIIYHSLRLPSLYFFFYFKNVYYVFSIFWLSLESFLIRIIFNYLDFGF